MTVQVAPEKVPVEVLRKVTCDPVREVAHLMVGHMMSAGVAAPQREKGRWSRCGRCSGAPRAGRPVAPGVRLSHRDGDTQPATTGGARGREPALWLHRLGA